MTKEKNFGPLVRFVAFLAGGTLIFLGGITFLVSTIPGIGLVVWSLTGNFWVAK